MHKLLTMFKNNLGPISVFLVIVLLTGGLVWKSNQTEDPSKNFVAKNGKDNKMILFVEKGDKKTVKALPKTAFKHPAQIQFMIQVASDSDTYGGVMMSDLGVTSLPALVGLDKNGQVIQKYEGKVDSDSLLAFENDIYRKALNLHIQEKTKK